jgi:hypothetical protein
MSDEWVRCSAVGETADEDMFCCKRDAGHEGLHAQYGARWADDGWAVILTEPPAGLGDTQHDR